jgi:hypothetical protein
MAIITSCGWGGGGSGRRSGDTGSAAARDSTAAAPPSSSTRSNRDRSSPGDEIRATARRPPRKVASFARRRAWRQLPYATRRTTIPPIQIRSG